MAATSVFFLADLVSGRMLNELPIAPTITDVTNVMGREDQQTFNLDTADAACPPDWIYQLTPGRTMLVQTLDDVVAQGWAVLGRTRGSVSVPIAAATLENCLSRTSIPDVAGTYEAGELASLLADPIVDRFGFIIDWSNTTLDPVERSYTAGESKILSALDDLKSSEGYEWRVLVRWHNDDPSTKVFDKILELAPRVGVDRPGAKFSLDTKGRGNIEDYSCNDSYADGAGATYLIGVEGSDGATPNATTPLIDDPDATGGWVLADDLIDQGWPVWEYRTTISGLGDVADPDAELLARTNAKLPGFQLGRTTWTVVGTSAGPQPGKDFDPGDTVYIDVKPQPCDPLGGSAALRVQGHTISTATGLVTPLFWEDPDDA